MATSTIQAFSPAIHTFVKTVGSDKTFTITIPSSSQHALFMSSWSGSSRAGGWLVDANSSGSIGLLKIVEGSNAIAAANGNNSIKITTNVTSGSCYFVDLCMTGSYAY